MLTVFQGEREDETMMKHVYLIQHSTEERLQVRVPRVVARHIKGYDIRTMLPIPRDTNRIAMNDRNKGDHLSVSLVNRACNKMQ